MSWLRYLGLTVPLAALRSYLYMATTATTSLFVLLPIAMITYDQYYKTLIPNESSPIIPLEIPGDQLKNWNNFKIILNNNNNDNINNQVSTPTAAQNQEIRYLIDDNFSWIQFDVKWTGFRYYMVKYYYSCYLIGTIIFFMVSAGVGFFTSYTILLLNNRNKL